MSKKPTPAPWGADTHEPVRGSTGGVRHRVTGEHNGDKIIGMTETDYLHALECVNRCAELAKPAPDGYHAQHEQDQREISTLRSALATARQKESGDTWLWAGDGSDKLHSMGNGMAVVIRARELRRLIAEGGKPAPVAVPDGWQLVPKEATENIVEGITHAKNMARYGTRAVMTKAEVTSIYQAMLAAAPQPPASAVDVERGTAVDRFFDTSAVPTAFGDMPRAEAEAIGLWPPAPSVDVEAVRPNGYGCVKPDTDKQVFFYEQDFYVLSNFSAFRVTFDGQT